MRHRLGKNVCRHLLCLDMHRSNEMTLHFVSKTVESQIQMLHASMMLWVLGNVDGRLVIIEGDVME